MSTPASNEGYVGWAVQSAKGTAATAFFQAWHTSFSWIPDVVQDDEPEAEIGGGMDVEPPERFGHQGATFRGEARLRPGNLGFVLRAFGMEAEEVKYIFHDGVNDVINVTDDGGGPVDVDILSGTGATAEADTEYTADEVCSHLKAVLDADTTLTQTYTVSFSTSTLLFTISHGGSTLSLHWSAATCNMGPTLGYDEGADDTGSTTYDGDYERRPQVVIVPGRNDAIRVSENSGSEYLINILTGTGAMLGSMAPYTCALLADGLECVLNADTNLTGTYTVTFDESSTQKFTIAGDGGLTSVELHWTDATCNLWRLLGFDNSADDTGAKSYTSDNAANWPNYQVFNPLAASEDFPWMTILDKFNSAADLDSLLIDAKVHTLSLSCESNDVIRLSYEGRALSFEDAVGTETSTADAATLSTPNTGNEEGYVLFAGGAYWAMTFSADFSWEERPLPKLTQAGPEELGAGRRGVSGNADIAFGADDGEMFRRAYYGGPSGTSFSTVIDEETLYLSFVAGTDTPAGSEPQVPYRLIIAMPECHILTYPLEKSGDDPVQAGMTWRGSRKSAYYKVAFQNGYAAGYYD